MSSVSFYSSRKRRKKAAKRRKRLLIASLLLGIGFLSLAALIGGSIFTYVQIKGNQPWPKLNQIKPKQLGQNSIIYARDGTLLGIVPSPERRLIISYSQMGQNLPNAVIAIEDQRFYKHNGFDQRGIARAALKDIETGQKEQGGSTITQQLVRNLYPEIGNEKTISRKSRELYLSRQLEQELIKQTGSRKAAKNQLLESYLNLVYFGRGAYGAEAASNTWFAKPTRNLSIAEAATLAGVIHSPGHYTVGTALGQAEIVARRDTVLRAMYHQKMITQKEVEIALATKLNVQQSKLYQPYRLPVVFDYVQRELVKTYGVARAQQGGLRVKTTISPRLQAIATQALVKNLGEKTDPAAATVLIDTKSGEILALASNRAYARSGFNLATQAVRQPGSSAKVWALTALVRQGVNPDNVIYSSYPFKATRVGGTEVWEPQTYDGAYPGPMSLRQATLRSDNSIYAQLALDLGPSEIVKTAHRLGITSPLQTVPSIVLGSQGVTVLEQTNFYSTLARGGVRIDPTAIASINGPTGQQVKKIAQSGYRIMPEYQAEKVINILRDNVHYGTGTAAQIPNLDVAGKTGTTDDHKDAWFCGMTNKITACVWVGYEQPKPMYSVHGIRVAGGTFPARIWHDIMERAIVRTQYQGFKLSSDHASWPNTWHPGAWRTRGEWE